MDDRTTERTVFSPAPQPFPGVAPVVRPGFTEEEVRLVREGVTGIKGMIPARCYYDESVYDFEVDNILKKNWLCVGRWDFAEKPGDYFSIEMFGEPLIIVRDKDSKLHALINACQHRWARLVPPGSGHTNLLVCPYHSWTYNLDGSLRGMSMENIAAVDRKDCHLPEIRLEEWQGCIFINFDPDAAPLAPQLAGLDEIIGRFNASEFRLSGRMDYDTEWNYKFSFETGYEAYHHEGVHKSSLAGTSVYFQPLKDGRIWGSSIGNELDTGINDGVFGHVFGPPPWMSEEEAALSDPAIVFGIFPSLIAFVNTHQISLITTQFKRVTANRACTSLSIAPWAIESVGAKAKIDDLVQAMVSIQHEDNEGCKMLQAGIVSKYNRRSIVHPLEKQLSHYYNWWMDQYLTA